MKNLLVLLILVALTHPGFGQREQISEALKKDNYSQALGLVYGELEKSPESPELYWYKAYSEQGLQLFSSSLASSVKGLSYCTEQDTIYRQLLDMKGISHLGLSELDSAVNVYRKLVELYPENIYYLLNLSYSYGENEQYFECIKVLNKGLELDSAYAPFLNNLSYYYGAVGQYEAAIKYSKKGLELAEDSVTIGTLLNNMGFAQGMTTDLQEGLKNITKSLKYQPYNFWAYLNLAKLYFRNDELDLGCEAAGNAIRLGSVKAVGLKEKYCN